MNIEMNTDHTKIPYDRYVLARINAPRKSSLDQEGCKWVVVIRRKTSGNKVHEFATGEFMLTDVIKWGYLPTEDQ